MRIEQIDIKTLSEKANSIFLSVEWLSIYNENLKCYGIFNKANELIGGFNFYIEKKLLYVKHYRNPAYNPTINLFFETKAKNKSKQLTENKKILMMIANFFNELPYHIITLNLPYLHYDMQSFSWKGFKVIPNYTYLINLENDISTIENNFSTERRNDIKKAVKDGIEARLSTDYKTIKELISNTFDRKNKALDIEMLDKILFSFANSHNSFAFISYKNEQAIAAAFFIYDQHKVYYLLGGYNSINKHQGGGALAVTNAIKHAKKLDIKIFDFEGSMLPEVEKYFRGFGGDLTTYFSVNRAILPLEISLKFFKRSIF